MHLQEEVNREGKGVFTDPFNIFAETLLSCCSRGITAEGGRPLTGKAQHGCNRSMQTTQGCCGQGQGSLPGGLLSASYIHTHPWAIYIYIYIHTHPWAKHSNALLTAGSTDAQQAQAALAITLPVQNKSSVYFFIQFFLYH